MSPTNGAEFESSGWTTWPSRSTRRSRAAWSAIFATSTCSASPGADRDRALAAGRMDAVVALKALTDPERFAGQPGLSAPSLEPPEATAYFAGVARELFG